VFVKVVPVIAVPFAAVLATIVPPVIVNPVVTLDTVNVYHKPFTAVGSVQDGLPEVDRLLNVCPHWAAVKATVAPTSALSVTVRSGDAPLGAAVNTGAAVNVATPVNAAVELTANVADDTAAVVTMFFAVLIPSSCTGGRYDSRFLVIMIYSIRLLN
jgi:hypothetical protein